MRGWRAQAHASSSLAFGTILIPVLLLTGFALLACTSTLATTVAVYATPQFVVLGVDGQTRVYDISGRKPMRLGTGDKFAELGPAAAVATYQLYAFTAAAAGGAGDNPAAKDYRWDRWIRGVAASEAAELPIPQLVAALAAKIEDQFAGWDSVLRSPPWNSQAPPQAELVGYIVAGFEKRRPYVYHLRLPIDRAQAALRPVEVSREYDGGRGFYLTVAGQRDAALTALKDADSPAGRRLTRELPELASRLHARRPRALNLAEARRLIHWLLQLESLSGDETGGPLTVATTTRDRPGWQVERLEAKDRPYQDE